MYSVSVPLTVIAPRQNPYSRAATSTLRMRLNRDERGLVVAEERDAEKKIRQNLNIINHVRFSKLSVLRYFNTSHHHSALCRNALTSSTKNVHVDLLQQTHHKSVDLR